MRDELVAQSTVALSTLTPVRTVPSTVPPPPGKQVTIGGADIFVRNTSSDADQPDMWFIHGLGGSSHDMSRLSYALAGVANCYAPDLPGSGDTPPTSNKNYAVLWQAQLIAAAIRRISRKPVHLVGNSRGGIVATAVAAQAPELVASLTLISPAVPDLRPVRDRGADMRLGMVMLPGAVEPASRLIAMASARARAQGLIDLCFGQPERVARGDVDALSAIISEQQRYRWVFEAEVRSLRSLIAWQLGVGKNSWRRLAARVLAPTLIIWGTRDRLVDVRLAARTMRAFRHPDLLVLPKTGHVAQIERPGITAAALVQHWQKAGNSGAAPAIAPTIVAA